MPDTLLARVSQCTKCPRLVAHQRVVKQQYPDYHAAPVGAWGSSRYRLLIVGLAPGLHGAARTGRAFVGDASGNFLFNALHRTGFASSAEPGRARLHNARITNVVKCLPPGNAPSAAEAANCATFLAAELAAFRPGPRMHPRVLLTLGGTAHRRVCQTLDVRGQKFTHGGEVSVQPNFLLISSFHPSRLNVNTGRLTTDMLTTVMQRIREVLAH